ncbi:MAG: efflux RND transporter periplasmic adaptor subunit [Spirochaetaceae bacterium]|jgi:membrane fusion protein (multidrug efflux system)|nr:efflux RND transporter periplasmic adaptor subunit [Spirochaetaceae bacterium]
MKIKMFIIITITLLFISCSNTSVKDETTSASWDPDKEVLPISVEALVVSSGKLIPYIETSGVVYGSKEAWAVSETQGKITELQVTLGQFVKEGDILLKVEDRLSKLNRDLALQQYESSQLDFEAIESSYKSGGYSRRDYNNARSRLLQSQVAYESAADVYNKTSIKAPFDGFIALLDNNITEGNYLTPGVRVARIINTSIMKMNISVGERQINLIKPGSKAIVSISSEKNSPSIEAEVQAIGMGSDQTTGSIPVTITWKNKEGSLLRSGLSARVEIKTKDDENKISIPSSAIVVRDRKKSVIISEKNKSIIKIIETGESLGGHTVILSGLEEGEVLIVSALSSLGNNNSIETSIVGTTGDWR